MIQNYPISNHEGGMILAFKQTVSTPVTASVTENDATTEQVSSA